MTAKDKKLFERAMSNVDKLLKKHNIVNEMIIPDYGDDGYDEGHDYIEIDGLDDVEFDNRAKPSNYRDDDISVYDRRTMFANCDKPIDVVNAYDRLDEVINDSDSESIIDNISMEKNMSVDAVSDDGNMISVSVDGIGFEIAVLPNGDMVITKNVIINDYDDNDLVRIKCDWKTADNWMNEPTFADLVTEGKVNVNNGNKKGYLNETRTDGNKRDKFGNDHHLTENICKIYKDVLLDCGNKALLILVAMLIEPQIAMREPNKSSEIIAKEVLELCSELGYIGCNNLLNYISKMKV